MKIIKYLFGMTDTYKDMELEIVTLKAVHTQSLLTITSNNAKIDELNKILDDTKAAGGTFVEDGDSSLVVVLKDNLEASVHTNINPHITDALLNDGYILSEHMEDSTAINLALVLVVNEITEQIINDTNKLGVPNVNN